ncbi:class I SAM-dependent DNA methyltransferase [Holzapfeliella sp. JNUCC 80]
MTYQSFAKVYDELMDKSLYPKWLDYVKRHVPIGSKILEIAAGAGDLSELLIDAGYEVTVTDLSKDMLKLAKDKLQGKAKQIKVLDMLELNDVDQYDAILCFDDSICYMSDLADVTQVFNNAYRALKPGGQFLFDAHSLYQMDELFDNYMFNVETEEYLFIWHSYLTDVEHAVVHDLKILTPDGKNRYQAKEELHYERTYPYQDYVRSLDWAGFSDIELTSDFSNRFDEKKAKRWFFRSKKG